VEGEGGPNISFHSVNTCHGSMNPTMTRVQIDPMQFYSFKNENYADAYQIPHERHGNEIGLA
jgi:hypothetical protein